MIHYLKYSMLLLLLIPNVNNIYAQLFINEVIPSNQSVLADNFGDFDDILELYNTGNSSINLAGYYLSDDSNNPLKWQIPATNSPLTTIAPGGYLILWADSETNQGENHLNFKLNNNGETIQITAPDEVTVVDQFTYPVLSNDISFGRILDGAGTTSILFPPSPGISNNNSQQQVAKPVISPPSGKYVGLQTINITAEAGATVYFTTDGSTPSTADMLYTGPFTIDSSRSIRAIAVKPNFADSDFSGNTYIIGATTDLPIVNITIDPFYFYDDSLGMYVIGTNGTSGPCHSDPRNWSQDWEYPASVTLFEKDGTVAFDEGCGLSISGGCSRNANKKSLNVSFKSKFGINKLEGYQLFETKNQTTWEGFKLRSGGNYSTKYRAIDVVAQRLIENNLDVDHQSSRAAVLYINGEYWGLYSIRDRMNAGYVKVYHPKVNVDSIDLIKLPKSDASIWHWIYEKVSEGNNVAYYDLYDFMSNNSLAIEANYNYVETQIDINSFLDYFVANIYYNNGDWPGNNLKTWRERSNHGKWRWMMFDLDFLLLYGGGFSNVTLLDQVMNSTDNSARQRNPTACLPFRKLMENPAFKAEYIQRTNTYINTLWDTTRVLQIFNEIKNERSNEIQADFNRWSGWDSLTWDLEFDKLYYYFTQRPQYAHTMINNVLGVSGTIELSFNFDALTEGVVAVHSNYFNLPYNYIGTYHDNVPIEIHAIPNPGYRFSHWLETGETAATVYNSYTSNTSLTPVFVPALDVIINEIHYHPSDTVNEKEFVEIYNPDTAPRDLSGYKITSGFCFTFPEDILIQPGEYLIIAKDASQFTGNGYQVFQWIESKLSNNGENIVLQNPAKQTIDSIEYSDNLPWPLLADGFGKSLELDYPVPANNDDGSQWHASQATNGSPGAQNSLPCPNNPPAIVINEINYNSNDIDDPSNWIELHNTTANLINIGGWTFHDSENTFNIPTGTTLDAGEFLILAEDTILFLSVFPHLQNTNKLLGNFDFSLSNGGERIAFFDQNQCLVDELRYNDKTPWDSIPDGNGPTLSLIDPNSDNLLPGSWEASSNINAPLGTPGRANTPCPTFSITVPGILCKEDTILLHTSTNNAANFNWNIQGGTPTSATGDSVYVVFQNAGLAIVNLPYTYFECSGNDQQLLTIDACNTAPISQIDNYIVLEDSLLSSNVLANDFDPENQPLAVSLINNAGNGSLTLNPDGSFTYIPNPNYFGSDNFIYEVCDNAVPALCATELVNIIINPVNDLPIADNDFFSGNEDNDLIGNVLLNDSDIDGNTLTSSIQTLPANGVLTLQADGNFTFTPNLNYFGSDAFTYEVCDDGSPTLCVIETVNLSISPVNDAPNTMTDNFSINEDNVLNNNVLTNDLEIEGQPMVSQLIVNCSNGSVVLNTDGSFSYNPNTNFEGTDSFVYEACDNSSPALCTQETVIITVLPVNDLPVVNNDTISTDEGIQVTGNASTNDFDIETNPMNYQLISFTQNGSILFNFDGSFYYTPFPGFSGVDSFQYKACDNGTPVYCDTATVYIDVIPDCVTIDIALFLEGAYNSQTGQQNTTLNTVRSLLPGMTGNPIAGQPYSSIPWNYQGTEGLGWSDANYDSTVVDWVLVSLRTAVTKASEVHQFAGLLHADGVVTFPGECLTTAELPGSYYVVVEHRNHMAVMSPVLVSVNNRVLSWDFRLANSYAVGGAGAKQLSAGVWGLYAGDCNQMDDIVSYDITGKDKTVWLMDNGKFADYLNTDINMNGDVNGSDKALWLFNNGIFGSVKK